MLMMLRTDTVAARVIIGADIHIDCLVNHSSSNPKRVNKELNIGIQLTANINSIILSCKLFSDLPSASSVV